MDKRTDGEESRAAVQGKTSLSAKQERFLAALLADTNIASAAKTCKIDESSAHRWLKTERFQQAYQEARRKAMDRVIARLQFASEHAVNTLMKNLLDQTNAPASVRSVQVRAAQAILERAIAATELEDLRQRLAALEALQGRVRHDV
jgi:formate dehydrogenase maturation protein FdhE